MSISRIYVRIFFLSLLWLSCCVIVNAQVSDAVEADTTVQIPYQPEIAPHVAADTTSIDARVFSDTLLNDLKHDPDFQYKQPPTIAESLWDRFLMWLDEALSYLLKQAVDTNWGRVIVYALALGLLVVLIMMLLKVDAFRILFSAQGSQLNPVVIDENIHEMDFDKLIHEAIQQHDYKRGVRLLFLYSLKLLADKDYIHWESGKTNHEYVAELQSHELKKGLNELSFYFDYAWYGNFVITADTFKKAETSFRNWKQLVR
jgi:hypothetical protein